MSKRLLIAVKSCQKDKQDGAHQAIRETWGKVLPEGVDLLFFVGGDTAPTLDSDERYVPVPDGYWELHPKMLAIVAYAVREDYDFVNLCDTDTYLILSKMIASGFDSYDYSGAPLNPKDGVFGKAYPGVETDYNGFVVSPFYVYLSGGHGTILSRKAAGIVAAAPRVPNNSEDLMLGQILGPFIRDGQLRATVLPNYAEHIQNSDASHGGPIAWHLNCGFYGGGHKQRLKPADAVRRKHQEIQRG